MPQQYDCHQPRSDLPVLAFEACPSSPSRAPLLQESTLDVAEALPADERAPPAARRLARTLQALLGLSSQMQDSMGAPRSHKHKQEVAGAIARLGANPARPRG